MTPRTTRSMTPARALRRYNGILLAGMGSLVAVLAVLYLFLLRSGENVNATDATQLALAGPIYYGSAIHDDSYSYKVGLYRAIKPEVIALGSSRVLQIREEHFRVPFVNMGRSMAHLQEGLELMRMLLAEHKPRLVIIGLDFFWFNESYPVGGLPHVPAGPTPFSAGLEVIKWLRKGKVSPRQFFTLLLHGRPPGYAGGYAVLHGTGYDRYGAYHYRGILEGRIPSPDPQFRSTLRQIREHDDGLFVYGERIGEDRWQHYQELLHLLESNGVAVITMVPPVADKVAAAMRDSGGYPFVDELRARLRERGSWHYDFHEAGSIGSGDCEQLDGFHGGVITYLRMLERIADDRGNPLARYLKLDLVRQTIREDAGLTAPRNSPHVYAREVDFLQLGCRKWPAGERPVTDG